MKFETLQDIKNYQWAGDHYRDKEAYGAIDDFLQYRTLSVKEAKKALTLLGESLGINHECSYDECLEYFKVQNINPHEFIL